jgi:hypothetical protein
LFNLLIPQLVLEILGDNIDHILHVVEHTFVIASLCPGCLINITDACGLRLTTHVDVDVERTTFVDGFAFGSFLVWISSEESLFNIFIRFAISTGCVVIKSLALLILIEPIIVNTFLRLG